NVIVSRTERIRSWRTPWTSKDSASPPEHGTDLPVLLIYLSGFPASRTCNGFTTSRARPSKGKRHRDEFGSRVGHLSKQRQRSIALGSTSQTRFELLSFRDRAAGWG